MITEFSPQALATTAWSFAGLALNDLPLMAAISAASIMEIASFELLNLANTAWAFSALESSHEPLLDAIAAAALSRISAEGDSLTMRSQEGLPLAARQLVSSI